MINTNTVARYTSTAVTGPNFIIALTLVVKSILQVYQRMQQCTLEINYKVFHIEDGILQQKDPFSPALFSDAKTIGKRILTPILITLRQRLYGFVSAVSR